MNQTIEVIVSPQGATRIETRGFTGTGCREASRSLEEALGIRSEEKLAAEFYEPAKTHTELRQGGAT